MKKLTAPPQSLAGFSWKDPLARDVGWKGEEEGKDMLSLLWS